MPNWLFRYLPYRAYLYLMGKRADRSLVMAYAIAQSETQAAYLKALLLARDITLEQIAARCKICGHAISPTIGGTAASGKGLVRSPHLRRQRERGRLADAWTRQDAPSGQPRNGSAR